MLASFAARTFRGRSFQILGPYTRKLRSPARFEVRGIVRRESFPVLRDLARAYGVTSSFRYAWGMSHCCIVGHHSHLKVNSPLKWKTMKLVKWRGNCSWNLENSACSTVLSTFQSLHKMSRDSSKKRITIVYPGSHEAIDQGLGTFGCYVLSNTTNIPSMESS